MKFARLKVLASVGASLALTRLIPMPAENSRTSRSDESRIAVGFSPREAPTCLTASRQRCLRSNGPGFDASGVATRRATIPAQNRGLKPTATVMASLRDADSGARLNLEKALRYE